MSPAPTAHPIPPQRLSAVVYRHRRLALITFSVVFACIVIGTLLMPKQYETSMKVLVKNDRADALVSAGQTSDTAYRSELTDVQINSEIELLTSNNLLQNVAAMCGLAHAEAAGDSVALERAVRRLRSDLSVSAVRRTNIITASYVDTDPHRAKTVLTALTELYVAEHLRLHGAPGTYDFFQTQVERFQEELKNAEESLAAFRHDKNIDLLAQEKDVALQKAAEAESAMLQAEAAVGEYTQRIADTRRQLGQAPSRMVTQSRTLSNPYSAQSLQTMLAELQNRRSALLAKFRPDDRLVQEVEQEVADTQAALEHAKTLTGLEEATDVNPVHQALELDLAKQGTELAGQQSRRNALAQQAASYRRQLARLADATAAYDDLVRKRNEAADNYALYSKKMEEARIADSLDRQKISNVAIAESPIEPHLPSSPNVGLNLALGLLFAGCLGLGVALTAEYVSNGRRPPETAPAETEPAETAPPKTGVQSEAFQRALMELRALRKARSVNLPPSC